MKHMQHFDNVSAFLVPFTVVKISKCQAVQRISCNNLVEYVFGRNAQESSDKTATFSSFSLWNVAFFPWGTLFLHFKWLFLRKQETIVSFSLTLQGNVDDFTLPLLQSHNITHLSMRDSFVCWPVKSGAGGGQHVTTTLFLCIYSIIFHYTFMYKKIVNYLGTPFKAKIIFPKSNRI